MFTVPPERTPDGAEKLKESPPGTCETAPAVSVAPRFKSDDVRGTDGAIDIR